MRAKHVATALAVVAAGMTAAATLRRFAGRRRSAVRIAAPHAPRTAAPAAPRSAVPVSGAPAVVVAPAPVLDAVVLPFPRRPITEPLPKAPAPTGAPARCGDNGGRTKSGAPCAARATSGGRCHHHKLTA